MTNKYEALVARVRYHIEKASFMGLKEAESTLLLGEAADAIEELSKSRWIPVTERLPSDFVSVQAHMTDAGNFPSVREAYVVDKLWFFPTLNDSHPVDMWRQFDELPKEE